MTLPKILITGANGFVGRNIVDHFLQAKSVNIVAGVRDPKSWGGSPDTNLQVVALDLCNEDNINAVLTTHQPDYIINCAAYGVSPNDRDVGHAYQTNVHAAVNLLRAAKQINIKRFVQIGSCSEYGEVGGLISEQQTLNPVGLYAASKASASLMMIGAAQTLDIDLCVLRLFNIWGKYELPHRLVQQILVSGTKNQEIKMSEGSQIRDFSYASQIASAIGALTLKPQKLPHSIYNIGTGDGITVRDFATLVASEFKVQHLLNFEAIPMRPDEVMSHIADITRLRQAIGQAPKRINSQQVADFISSTQNNIQ